MTTLIDKDFPNYLLDIFAFDLVGPIEQVHNTKICLFKHRETGKDFYVRFPAENPQDPVSSQRRFLNEIWIQIRLRHPAIQFFRGFTLSRDVSVKGESYSSSLFFENDSVMSLQDMIDLELKNQAPPEWTPTKKSCVVFGLAAALKYIHSLRIIHNNIKTTKILLNKDYEPLLSDFSNAAIVQSPTDGCLTTYNVGTLAWKSPEMINERPYTLPSDVFAFGQIVHSIMSLKLPFPQTMANKDVQEQLSNWDQDTILERSKGLEQFEDGYLAIYQTAVFEDPDERPSMEQFYDEMVTNDALVYPGTDIAEYRQYCNKITSFVQA